MSFSSKLKGVSVFFLWDLLRSVDFGWEDRICLSIWNDDVIELRFGGDWVILTVQEEKVRGNFAKKRRWFS